RPCGIGPVRARRERHHLLAGLRVEELEVGAPLAAVGDHGDALPGRRYRGAVEPGHEVKAVVGLDQAIDEHGLGTAAGLRGDDVRETQMSRDYLAVDQPFAVDLLDAREEHRLSVARDTRLMRAAIRCERCVALPGEHVDVTTEREGDRPAHGRVHPWRERYQRDGLRRCRRGTRRREERWTDPDADAEIKNDEHGRDAGEDELSRPSHYEIPSTAATTRSISFASSGPLTSSRKPSAGGSNGCRRMRS